MQGGSQALLVGVLRHKGRRRWCWDMPTGPWTTQGQVAFVHILVPVPCSPFPRIPSFLPTGYWSTDTLPPLCPPLGLTILPSLQRTRRMLRSQWRSRKEAVTTWGDVEELGKGRWTWVADSSSGLNLGTLDLLLLGPCSHTQGYSLHWCPSHHKALYNMKLFRGWTALASVLEKPQLLTPSNRGLIIPSFGQWILGLEWTRPDWKFSVCCFVVGRWHENWETGSPKFSDVNSIRRVRAPSLPFLYPSSTSSTHLPTPSFHLWLPNSVRSLRTLRFGQNWGTNISTQTQLLPVLAFKQEALLPAGFLPWAPND